MTVAGAARLGAARRARGRRIVAAVAGAAVLGAALPGCTVGVRRSRDDRPRATRSAAPVSVPPCRTTYAAPDPARPRVTLAFEVDAGHRTVTGTERVVFTPDRPVGELVFRLWLNGPGSVSRGGRIEVTSASLPMAFESAGAGKGTQGTLLRLALPAPVPAGRRVTATLAFTLTLPRADVDRWGHTAETAWWASAHPMLAWVRGAGWDDTDAVGLLGETAANETAVHDVTVVAPFADTVLGIGLPDEPVATAAGTRRWRFRNAVARDVAISAGPFVTERETVSGVPVVYAVSDAAVGGLDARRVLPAIQRWTRLSLAEFTSRFGPFPYPSLTVVALAPIGGAGVEYPGLIFVGSRRYDVVVPHEVAHEWFYGLVGNDQGDAPWIDEAFASYAEALVNEASGNRFLDLVTTDGAVGLPMSHWDDHRDDYGRVVYGKGAGALLAARQEIGAAAFDALLRCFVNRHAHRVATPDDLAAAFAPAPAVGEILRDAGALP